MNDIQDAAEFFFDFADVYSCMINEIGEVNVYGDLIFATDLFRLEYSDDFGGKEGVAQLLEGCGASDFIVDLLTNRTVYDATEEEEDFWSELAQSLDLSKGEYYAVITVGVSCFIVCIIDMLVPDADILTFLSFAVYCGSSLVVLPSHCGLSVFCYPSSQVSKRGIPKPT